uniref:G_PROTEIN_RECEP_F1_2 domain-containing protein n=1 Tax=Angiostrongylus cantonensis TaxID=6313 RepID=A0A0K0D791_ANGCA
LWTIDWDQFASLSNNTGEFAVKMFHMKNTFTILQIIFCLVGIIGNILNLRTLQSPSLQTVPFMYIRSLALFDLISLSAILVHFILEPFAKIYVLMIYSTYIEATLINTFLVGGLYCAFILLRFFKTNFFRCLMISRPHVQLVSNPRRMAHRKILAMVAVAAFLHLPMMLQNSLKKNDDGTYQITNNVDLLCREPHWTVFNYYKMTRECLRFFIVAFMSFLNVIIARNLHLNKMRRRRLVRRPMPFDMNLPDHPMMNQCCSNDTTLRYQTNLSFKNHSQIVILFALIIAQYSHHYEKWLRHLLLVSFSYFSIHGSLQCCSEGSERLRKF